MSTTVRTTPYTVDELLAMPEDQFFEVVTADIAATKRHGSAFLERAVIDRTQHALVDHLWRVDASIRRQAADPACPIERYDRSLSFRRLLLSAVDLVERRIDWLQGGSKNRAVKAWKDLVADLAIAIEEGPLDALLDEYVIPFGGLSLRQFLDMRDAKDAEIDLVKTVAA